MNGQNVVSVKDKDIAKIIDEGGQGQVLQSSFCVVFNKLERFVTLNILSTSYSAR